MLVRFSWWESSIPVLVGFVLGTVVWSLEHSKLPPFAFAFAHPALLLQLTPLIAIVVVLRVIPWARLTKDGVTALDTLGRIKTINWNEVVECKPFALLGVSYLRFYSSKSRFGVWLLVPHSSGDRIKSYLTTHANSSAVQNAIGV